MKQPMKSRDVLPKNVPGVGWGGVMSCRGGWVIQRWGGSHRGGVGYVMQGWGWVMQRWGGSYRRGMTHTEHYHHLHTVPCGNYLELLEGAKFNYNHTPNYLQLLREHKFNYNHKLRL